MGNTPPPLRHADVLNGWSLTIAIQKFTYYINSKSGIYTKMCLLGTKNMVDYKLTEEYFQFVWSLMQSERG